MTVRAPFAPKFGANQVLAPAAASATVTIGFGSKSLRLCNTGANVCYVRTCYSGDPVGTNQTASTADTPVLAGTVLIISKPQDHDTLATISASGTTLLAQPGEGGF